MSSQSIVSSSRTVRSCTPWGVNGLDIGGQHGGRFVLLHHSTGHRGGHTSFVQTGAEASDTGAEAVKPNPRCSWQGHSEGWVPVLGMKVRSLIRLSNHSAFHWWSSQCAARMLLSNKLIELCGGTNGCLGLRRRAFQLWTGERWVEQVSRLHGTAC